MPSRRKYILEFPFVEICEFLREEVTELNLEASTDSDKMLRIKYGFTTMMLIWPARPATIRHVLVD